MARVRASAFSASRICRGGRMLGAADFSSIGRHMGLSPERSYSVMSMVLTKRCAAPLLQRSGTRLSQRAFTAAIPEGSVASTVLISRVELRPRVSCEWGCGALCASQKTRSLASRRSAGSAFVGFIVARRNGVAARVVGLGVLISPSYPTPHVYDRD